MIWKVLNLSLLILFPIAWFAPLMRAGFLPFFKLSEVSVMTGISSMWDEDVLLALIVVLFAIFAPIAKVIGTALIQFDYAPKTWKPVIQLMGKFAMADIFLVAIYIVVAKGVGVGRLEVAWGLYLFTACVLMGFLMSLKMKPDA
tara:strand:- start:3359 stop:3790 length:432 start_codon:yes stop_codon:yes gene_type:complete